MELLEDVPLVEFMYRWWNLCTAGEVYVPLVEFIRGCNSGGVYVPLVEFIRRCTSGGVYVLLVEFMYRWWSLCTVGGVIRGCNSGGVYVPCIYSHAK